MNIIKAVLDNKFTDLKAHVEGLVTDGINKRIESKKVDVLAALNGIDRNAQMEVMAIN